jgi:predicted Fe-Mo cluster-binding NifX family protein
MVGIFYVFNYCQGDDADMKIALTVWEDRISPVFDVANKLLVVDIEQCLVQNARLLEMEPGGLLRLVDTLKRMEIKVLICGAISQVPANMLSAGGIKLIPFISGNTDHILAAYTKGEPIMPAFAMPGVKRRRRKRGQPLPLSGREPVRRKHAGRGRNVNT